VKFFDLVYQHAPPNGVLRWGPAVHAVFVTLKDLREGNLTPQSTDLFFGPAVRKGPEPSKANVLGACVCWLDYDGEGVPVSLLPASIKVQSGGPGRFHFYWLLNEFIETEELEQVNRAISAHHGDNGGTWDATRILRVPGSINSKYNPPREVKVVEMHENRVYSPDDLVKLKPYDPNILRVPEGKSRSERDFRIARLMQTWGLSKELVSEALTRISDKAKERGSGYVIRTVNNAAPKTTKAKTQQQDKPPKKLANFYLVPVGELVGPDGEDEGLVLEVRWSDGTKRVSATQQDFNNKRSLNILLHRNGLRTRAWVGTDRDVGDLWMSLVEHRPTTEMLLVRQAGRHDLSVGGQRVFVYGTNDALFHPPDKPGLPVFWEPQAEATLTTTLVEGPLDGIPELLDITLQANIPEIVHPSVGWILSTPFKPLIERAGMRFPIMLAFGMKGSGKTTLIRDILLPLVGVRSPPLGADVTRFALIAALSAYNALPLWIGEFRSSLHNLDDVQSHLRLVYDGGKAERGRPDLTVSSYHLTSPVIIDGESLFPDSALRERTLPVRMIQKEILTGSDHATALATVKRMTESQTHFAYEYIQWTLTIDDEQVREWLSTGEGIFNDRVPYSRLAHTASVAWMGMHALGEFVKEKIPRAQVPKPDVEAIYKTLLNTFVPGLGVVTPVESLVEIVVHSYKQGQQWADACCEWHADEGVLWVNFTTAIHWVRRFCREIPERDMLLPQIGERVGVYLLPPIRIEGGLFYGVNIKMAQDLGLDVPTPTGPLRIGEII